MLGYSLAFAAFGELGEILASAEYLASAGNDDCTNSRIGFGVVHDVFHGLGSRSVKRICHIGAIDANDQQAVFAKFRYNRISAIVISHCVLLCCVAVT